MPFNKSREKIMEQIEEALNSEFLGQEQKKYLEDSKLSIHKWCAAFKKLTKNLGVNESNRVENVNKYLKKLLNSSVLSISELLIRFLQFEEIYNKKDNISLIDINKYLDIKGKMEEIELVKKFSEKFSRYATIKFTN